jgi:hypothetical protein
MMQHPAHFKREREIRGFMDRKEAYWESLEQTGIEMKERLWSYLDEYAVHDGFTVTVEKAKETMNLLLDFIDDVRPSDDD